MFLPSLLPAVPDLCLETLDVDEHAVRLTTRVTNAAACCPLCAEAATRVHSRYQRTLADLPCVARIVRVLVQIRRFFCDNPACLRVIFAERLGSAVAVYARRTARQASHLQRVAFAVGGEAGALLSTVLGMPASASTLLRLQRRATLPTPEPPTVIGVDDFAFRKGQRYGTLIIDLERHRRIDVLPDREASTLAAWLRQQPQIAVISRDRSTAYAEAAAEGAPQAIQVADRFHLVKNAGEALQRVLQRHPAALRAAAQAHADSAQPSPAAPAELVVPPVASCRPAVAAPQAELTDREHRFRRVLELHAQGWNIQQIVRAVQLNRRTVQRYIRARELPKRGGPAIQVTSGVRPYLRYVEQRWREGCHNMQQLRREITAQGYRGSHSSMRRALKHLRQGDGRRIVHVPTTLRLARAFSPRQGMWLLVLPEDELDAAERAARRTLLNASAALATAAELVQSFGHLVRERTASALDPWLEAATSSGLGEFKHFATSLRRDYAAVRAALETCWSNGQLEGQVNRLKGIKKAMYGRGKFDLLRQRVLYAT